jgi:hypothetical protein
VKISPRARTSAVLAAAVGIAASIVVTTPAGADITTQYLATSANASDPFAFPCAEGYCLVASQDLNQAPIDPGGPGENYYPMSKTLGWTSADGLKWSSTKTVLDEANIGRSGFKHQWAPAVRPVRNGSGPVPPWEYYLYTPNLTNKNDKYSSRIFVSYSTNSMGPYGVENIENTNVKWKELTGAPAGLYMSDPEVFTDDADRTTPDNSKDYLIWANGDYGNCGDISIRKMTSETSIQSFTDANSVRIKIDGISALGDCGNTGHPYVEGASLFRSDWWKGVPNGSTLPGKYVLVASVKPSVVPFQCSVPGQTNNTNQVIAYATSNTVTGPYTYRGVLSCGSTTEWTNQGTIQEVKTEKGEWRLMLIHHDGKAASGQTPRNRQMHSECLNTLSNQFLTSPKSPEGAVNVSGTRQWCLTGKAGTIFALRSQQTGKWVVSQSNTQLAATSNQIGLWEQLGWANGGSATYDDGIVPRNPGNLWIQVNRNDGNKVIARGTAFGDWEQLQIKVISGTTVEIKDNRGWWIRTDSSGKLYATSTAPTSSTLSSYRFTLDWLST